MAAKTPFRFIITVFDDEKIVRPPLTMVTQLPKSEIGSIQYEKGTVYAASQKNGHQKTHSYQIIFFDEDGVEMKRAGVVFRLDEVKKVTHLSIEMDEPNEDAIIAKPVSVVPDIMKPAEKAKPASPEPKEILANCVMPAKGSQLPVSVFDPQNQWAHHPMMYPQAYYYPHMPASPQPGGYLMPPAFFLPQAPPAEQKPAEKTPAKVDVPSSPIIVNDLPEFDDSPLSTDIIDTPPPVKPKSQKKPASFAAAAAKAASSSAPPPPPPRKYVQKTSSKPAADDGEWKKLISPKKADDDYSPFDDDFPMRSRGNLFRFFPPSYYMKKDTIENKNGDIIGKSDFWCRRFPITTRAILIRWALSEGVQDEIATNWQRLNSLRRSAYGTDRKYPMFPDYPDSALWFSPFYAFSQKPVRKEIAACNIFNCFKVGKISKCRNGNNCDYPHICMFCGSSDHGAFFREEDGTLICPINRRMNYEIQQLKDLNLAPANIGHFMHKLWLKYKEEDEEEQEEPGKSVFAKTIIGTPAQRSIDTPASPKIVEILSPVPNLADMAEFPAMKSDSPAEPDTITIETNPEMDEDGFRKQKSKKKRSAGKNAQ